MTWTRKELKTRAKAAFKKNIVACIVAAFILALVSGAFSSNSSSNSSNSSSSGGYEYDGGSIVDTDDLSSEDLEELFSDVPSSDEGSTVLDSVGSFAGSLTGMLGTVAIVIARLLSSGVFILIALFFIAIAIVLNVFVMNPIAVGCRKFFRENEAAPASLDNILYVFKCGSYMNVVKIMFIRDLRLIGWSLLLIIPGIVKTYEYMMIPYLLADNPEMDKNTAFAATCDIMNGQKMDTFILRLSFILWDIVGSLLFGIPEILFVNPYKYQTNAELYLTLTGQYGQNDPGNEYEYEQY